MRVLPILFNTEMVRAILDGRKSCTRRLVKPQLPQNVIEIHEIDPMGYLMFKTDDKYLDWWRNCKAPYKVGDILYVRETWTKLYYVDEDGCTHYDQEMIYYLADGIPDTRLVDADGFEEDDQTIKWHPNIHMKKEAARIWLKVTEVRVERIDDMSIQDMINEGINTDGIITTDGPIEYRVINRFEELWNSTVKEDSQKFEANPYVWVIEFERCEKPQEGGSHE